MHVDKIVPIMQSPLWMTSLTPNRRFIYQIWKGDIYVCFTNQIKPSNEFIRIVLPLMNRSIHLIYKDDSQRPAYNIPRQSIHKLISFPTLGRKSPTIYLPSFFQLLWFPARYLCDNPTPSASAPSLLSMNSLPSLPRRPKLSTARVISLWLRSSKDTRPMRA